MSFLVPNNFSASSFAVYSISALLSPGKIRDSWHFKSKMLPMIQIMYFRNLFWLSSGKIQILIDYLLSLMEVSQLEAKLINIGKATLC